MYKNYCSYVVFAFLLSGCFGDDSSQDVENPIDPVSDRLNDAEQLRLEASKDIWVLERDKNHGNYHYESEFSSWVGFGYVTKIFVSQNTAYRRAFEAYDEGGTVTVRYDEDASILGTNDSGHPVKTVDELYEECSDILSTQSPDENDITFTISNIGIISTCTYIPHSCADDCSQGVSINNLTFTN